MRMSSAAIIAALLAAPVAAGANGYALEDPYVKASESVRLSDLNLSSISGQKVLAIRLRNAARAVCGNEFDLATLHLMAARDSEACQEQTIARVRNQIEARSASAEILFRQKLAARD